MTKAKVYPKINGLVQRPGIDHDPIKPWQWATLIGRDDPVEIVSFPIPSAKSGAVIDSDSTIMIRLKVGEPGTLLEVPLRCLAVFAPSRHEWAMREKRYYDPQNPTAFYFVSDHPGAACAAILREVQQMLQEGGAS